MTYQEIIARRRALRIDGYRTLADVGFDGDWVTPYQMAAHAPDGPVLVAHNWLDAPSVEKNRAILKLCGYLPKIMFNNVIDRALNSCNICRNDLYITQAFHLLPAERSSQIRSRDIDASFDAVTRHELVGRQVIALGSAASNACSKHNVAHSAVHHPSARGLSYAAKAEELAKAITETRKYARN
jgi:hypothetical protein